jgi:hypothetical protein
MSSCYTTYENLEVSMIQIAQKAMNNFSDQYLQLHVNRSDKQHVIFCSFEVLEIPWAGLKVL